MADDTPDPALGPAKDLDWKANDAALTTTGLVHNPNSAWAKEARKWEATYTQFGPAGRPYVFRQYPTWMFLAGAPPNGGAITILDMQICATENQRSGFESRGFRMEPLEAIAYYEKQQLEYAKLAAEREYEKRHGKMSARARQEVEDVEEAAGAQHLPTIAARPGRKRGQVASRMTPTERARRSREH